MKKSVLCMFLSLLTAVALADGFNYSVKVQGANITPSQALQKVKQNSKHTFIIDVRTRPEYQVVGHSVGAYNIPYMFWTNKFSGKKYTKQLNADFVKAVMSRFDIKTDTLIVMCRSGKRSAKAYAALLKTGWDKSKLFNMLGGFEGGKVKNVNSIFNGQRKLGGWRNEGLPWTYHINSKLIYK